MFGHVPGNGYKGKSLCCMRSVFVCMVCGVDIGGCGGVGCMIGKSGTFT